MSSRPFGSFTAVALAGITHLVSCGDAEMSSSSGGGAGAQAGGGASTGTTGTGGSGGEGGGDEPNIDCNVATCRFVRAAAAPGGDGLDWSTAFQAFPQDPERGATYLVADGDYGQLLLDATEDGDAWIEIRKATVDDHGTDVGWASTDGDGQASFSDIILVSDFWIIDGRARDESDWARVDAYGFRTTSVMMHTINFGRGSSDVVMRYVDVGGPPNGTFDPSLPREGFYFGGFDVVLSRWTVSRSHVHDVYLPFQLAGASEITIERSWLGPNWSKETIRGQGQASFITVRHNVLKDGCQGTPGDPTAGACTAQIAMWDGDVPGTFDGSEIYGNLFWTTVDTPHSDGCILVGGDGGVSAAGVSANDVKVYNNTFVGIQNGRCAIRMPGTHTGDHVANNLWFGLGAGVTTECEADTCDKNEVALSDPFVSAQSGDFRLAGPTSAGTPLPSPYDVDRFGMTRGADGSWDLGAYEYAP